MQAQYQQMAMASQYGGFGGGMGYGQPAPWMMGGPFGGGGYAGSMMGGGGPGSIMGGVGGGSQIGTPQMGPQQGGQSASPAPGSPSLGPQGVDAVRFSFPPLSLALR